MSEARVRYNIFLIQIRISTDEGSIPVYSIFLWRKKEKSTAHKTVYNETTKIIETKLFGKIEAAELNEIIQNDANLSFEHSCYLWLNDYSEATFHFSTGDIYHFPAVQADATEILGNKKHLIRRATVVPSITDDEHFEEAMSIKYDQHFHAFSNIEDARKWLSTPVEDLLK